MTGTDRAGLVAPRKSRSGGTTSEGHVRRWSVCPGARGLGGDEGAGAGPRGRVRCLRGSRLGLACAGLVSSPGNRTRMGVSPPGLPQSLLRRLLCPRLANRHKRTSRTVPGAVGSSSGSRPGPQEPPLVLGFLVTRAHWHLTWHRQELAAQSLVVALRPLCSHFTLKTQKPRHKVRNQAPNTSSRAQPPRKLSWPIAWPVP